ncbi:MAG: biotin--[acetyl-CoA-carboxylase] ligase [Nitrospiria bacterium]
MSINVDQITAYCRAQAEVRDIIHEALLFDEITSTNKIALEMASDGMPEGLVILAESQTRGKGRLDRDWYSPPGKNIYASFFLRPALQVREYPLFSPAAALGLVNGIEAFTGLACQIKWPNDLMISDKKVGGILLETGASGAQSAALVIGAGINVNINQHDFPETLQDSATSLKIAAGAHIDRTGLIIALIEGLSTQIHSLQKGGANAMFRAVREKCATLGQKVRVTTPRQVFEGRAESIDDDGALLIRLGDQSRRRILIGDISHLRTSEGATRTPPPPPNSFSK